MSFGALTMTIVGIVGFMLACIGFGMEYTSIRLERRGVPVETEVLELVERRSDGGRMWAPVFVVRGGEHDGERYVSKVATNPPNWRVGYRSDGYYDPKTGVVAPRRANDGNRRFALALSSIGLGLGLSIAIYAVRARAF